MEMAAAFSGMLLCADGVYSHGAVSGTNEAVVCDTEKPHGKITVEGLVSGNSSVSWKDRPAGEVVFELFGQHTVRAVMEGWDDESGVDTIEYLVEERELEQSGLEEREDWKPYERPLTFSANQRLILYEKVTDASGNTAYFSSDGVIIDNTAQAPDIWITPSVPAGESGIYCAADQPGVTVWVEDPPVNSVYAGIHEITCQIVDGTTGETEKKTTVIGREAHQQTWSQLLLIDPEKFSSNEVYVTVTAKDWSENETASHTERLMIDSKPPKVSFSLDDSDAGNGRYFKKDKTLVITVKERNFDPSYLPLVTSTADGGWTFGGWQENGEIHTGTVAFSKEGAYSVTYKCCDLAGNQSNTGSMETIIIDRTAPEIEVSYDNENVKNERYYRKARTAAVTVKECNFDPAGMQITAGDGNHPASLCGWSVLGNQYTAAVKFDSDGEYSLHVSCTDLAGNTAVYEAEPFVVDLTEPVIEIAGVKESQAYQQNAAPFVVVKDRNFSQNEVKITLKGVRNGEIRLDDLTAVTDISDGRIYTMQNLPKGMDDIYTLSVGAADQAGNEACRSVTFSVNRDGSNYIIGEKTRELIEKGYAGVPRDIELEEINVSTLKFSEITYSKDGEMVALEAGTDYTVKEEGGENGWKKYTYRIFASCFEEEGTYILNIYSEDTAGNKTTNKGKAKNIVFTVDKTPPLMVVSNLADGGHYREERHRFTVQVKDHTAPVMLKLYLDGKLERTYESEELNVQDGVVDMELMSSSRPQKIELAAYDAAGNETKEAYTTGREAKDGKIPAVFHVVVSEDKLVQYYRNQPLFYGSIAALVILPAAAVLTVKRRRKKG